MKTVTDNSSFLFIPDISGFSEFMYETEIEHSQHIISELLELIINANQLAMDVMEIEGDAILFYKKEVPQLNEILDQSKKMFIDFHHHLRKYDTLRICQCGACSSASKLTLKFIAHSGSISHLDVGGFKKMHGKDVVLVHKLLKNSIADTEYLLVTESTIHNEALSELEKDWVSIHKGSDLYDENIKVKYAYILLHKLKEHVPLVEHLELPPKTKNPFRYSVNIEAPLNLVQANLMDLSKKKLWFKNIVGVEHNNLEINKVGSEHVCIVNNENRLNFQTITNDYGSGKWVYGEKLLNPPIAKDVEFYFITERIIPTSTILLFELHVTPKSGIMGLFAFFAKIVLKRTFKSNIEEFKMLCESKTFQFN